MRKLTQGEVLEVTGASQRNIENWMARLSLSTEYEATVQGRARGFSRENAVELALMRQLIEGGMRPAAAAECLAKLFAEIKAKKPHGWAIFLAGGHYLVSDERPKFLDALAGSAVVVNVAKVEADVDAFLDKLDEE